MAVEFLRPILTPAAFATVSAAPEILVTFLLVQLGLAILGGLAWYIHYVTEKAYPRKKEERKGGGMIKGLLGKLGFGGK